MSFFIQGARNDPLKGPIVCQPNRDGVIITVKTATRTYRLDLEREDAMNLYADIERDLGIVNHSHVRNY